MTHRSHRLLAATVVAALALAACGSDDTDEPADDAGSTDAPASSDAGTPTAAETDAPAATDASASSDAPGGDGTAVDLAGKCPETVVIQLDWMPEAEHGFLYQLIGEGYEIDANKAYVTGPLIDSGGNDTGVDLQLRSGGAPQNFSPPTQIMYTDEDILLAYVYTDEAIQFSAEFPTVAIESGFEKNPQMIMWDPETYPDVETIEDLGQTDAVVRYFGGAAYMDYLTGSGIIDESNADGSYSGDPTLFVADEGAAAQQGFGSAEPYLYEHEIENWMKPVEYQYINETGWENYAQSIATKPENIEAYADCFTDLVPIVQQASVDYLNDPARASGIILDAVEQFGGNFGWTYSEGAAKYGVETMKTDGLVANGPDETVGNFDMERVNGLIELAVPIYTDQGTPPKDGVTAEDIVTNQFIDPSIGF